ncbi:hypothetical protein CC86DRAFT_372407 [Ophiobolus disseminans]|uniref:Uncharacterized protein n=1 Tax=Ophiobolus disseminans TaxID=1469910 RepID=A0A6A6ZS74_9PLEO|nr:hypothetical protein CC86DRAFT_372407 [Ophiobolus disseminans]
MDLCTDIRSEGNIINDAVREMKAVVGVKGHPEQAFKRWENTYCGPDIKAMLVKCNKQQRIEDDLERSEYAERMIALLARETEAFELVAQKKSEIAEVVQEKVNLMKEGQKLAETGQQWLVQHGRELSQIESKEALETWFAEEIDRLKPTMLVEAKRCVLADVKQLWQLEKSLVSSATNKVGRSVGYKKGKRVGRDKGNKKGYIRGKNYGLQEMSLRMTASQAVSRAEAARKDTMKAIQSATLEGWNKVRSGPMLRVTRMAKHGVTLLDILRVTKKVMRRVRMNDTAKATSRVSNRVIPIVLSRAKCLAMKKVMPRAMPKA